MQVGRDWAETSEVHVVELGRVLIGSKAGFVSSADWADALAVAGTATGLVEVEIAALKGLSEFAVLELVGLAVFAVLDMHGFAGVVWVVLLGQCLVRPLEILLPPTRGITLT